jgi:hypothetical protein
MPEYRIFQLDDADRFRGPSIAATHETDQDVIAEVRKTLDGATIEMWEGSRCVATIRPNDKTPRV